MRKIVFLGPPGGGKGSQAQRIAPALGIPHISTGDMLRQNIAIGTELGKAAKAFIDAGGLVPDELILDMMRERLSRPDCEKGYLLDGFPRTLAQAADFDKMEKLTHVLNIDAPSEEILRRLTGRRVCQDGHTTHLNQLVEGRCPLCGKDVFQRQDDQSETVLRRLAVYHEQTEPLIEHYRAQGILHDIDGSGSIDQIEPVVLKVLS